MRIWFKAVLALGIFMTAAPAFAQEVIVTANRRGGYLNSYADGDTRPFVHLRRSADYVVQTVRIVGDTRDEAKRREEVYAMVRNAVEIAGRQGVELSTGNYIIEPLTMANYTNLALSGDGRADTSVATFLVKVKLEPGMDAKTALGRIGKFVAAVPAVGRAEMRTVGELTLSVVNPDQYRGQIIDLIAADAKGSAGKFGPDYGVQISGLDKPVEWTRGSLTEVFLYLPVEYVIRPKGN
jgi:hypothetical protein